MKQGISLIELLLFMSLFTILISLGAVSFLSIWRTDQLGNTALLLQTSLYNARYRAMAGQDDLNWGVFFSQDQYILFKGNNFNPQDSNNQTYSLTNLLEFNEINVPNSSIIFGKINGEVVNYQEALNEIVLREKQTGREVIVSVTKIGKVEIN